MDVRCSTCGEPWDVHHLWDEAIYDTTLPHDEAKNWHELSRKNKLSPQYRKVFRAAGWEFGAGVINVIHCPNCPEGAKPDLERLYIKSALEDILGDDEDGLAVTFEDHDL